MSAAAYFEAQPHAALRDVVRCVWVYAPDAWDAAPQRIAPDGCPELVIHFGEPYVRLENGTVKFHKDGYTDQRGKFDYASVSTPEKSPINRFSILVLSEEFGALIKEANPPAQ